MRRGIVDPHYVEDMRECVRLNLVVGYPGRLTPGETRVSRARKEIARMREMDERIIALRELGDEAAIAAPTNADKFREIHGKSLDFFDEVLSTPVVVCEENAKLLNVKLQAASKTIGVGARVAIELYRGQKIGALARLLERLAEPVGDTIENGPALIGFDE